MDTDFTGAGQRHHQWHSATGGVGTSPIDGDARTGPTPAWRTVTLGNGSTLAQGTGGAVTLQSNSGTAALNASGTGNTLSAPVTLATNTTVTVASGGTLGVSGKITGRRHTHQQRPRHPDHLRLRQQLQRRHDGQRRHGEPDGGGGGRHRRADRQQRRNGHGRQHHRQRGGQRPGPAPSTLTGGTLQNGNLTAPRRRADGSRTNNYQNGGLLTLANGTTSVIDFGAGNTGAVFSFTARYGGQHGGDAGRLELERQLHGRHAGRGGRR